MSEADGTSDKPMKKPRPRGMGRVFQRGEIWWVAYWHRGKEFRETSRSAKKVDADKLLKRRLGEIGRGRLIGPSEEKITFEMLAADFETDRGLRGPRSLRDAKERTAHLKGFFGLDLALDVTTPRIREYIRARRDDDHAKPATINRELAALSRMFNLAVQACRLSTRPHVPRLPEAQPRQGFFEHAEYLALRKHLPAAYRDVLDFGYLTGWRKSEILSLEWRDVERAAGVIRLRPEVSKNREGRTLVLNGPLKELIERRWKARSIKGQNDEQRVVSLVFHKKGRPIGDWRKTWKKACVAAKVPGRLFHDLRRTVARNLIRAGHPERVAMAVTGHKTRSVFDRYNIVSEADLRRAMVGLADYVETLPTKSNVREMRPARQPGK
jgi:integrase